jgi:hypothetical protein
MSALFWISKGPAAVPSEHAVSMQNGVPNKNWKDAAVLQSEKNTESQWKACGGCWPQQICTVHSI